MTDRNQEFNDFIYLRNFLDAYLSKRTMIIVRPHYFPGARLSKRKMITEHRHQDTDVCFLDVDIEKENRYPSLLNKVVGLYPLSMLMDVADK